MASEQVTFRGDVTVAVAAWLTGLDLEHRGIALTVDGDSLIASPRHLLTVDDHQRIRRHKADLIRLATYTAPSPAWLSDDPSSTSGPLPAFLERVESARGRTS